MVKVLSAERTLLSATTSTPTAGLLAETGSRLGKDPDALSGNAVRQWDKTYTCCGNRQTLTSPSDSVLPLKRTSHARVLSDTTYSLTVTSDSVCPTTVSGNGSGS